MKLFSPLTALLLFAVSPAGLTAQELPRASALEEKAVRALVGQESIITGKVTDAFESPKGMTFLNLEGGRFTVVAWKESYEKFEGGSPAKLYRGKTIEVTGKVFEFRPKAAAKTDPGKLEIKLTSPDQIKIVPPAETGPAKPGSKPDEAPKKEGTPARDVPATEPAVPTPELPETPAAPGKAVDSKKYFK